MERVRNYWAYMVQFLSSSAWKGAAVILSVAVAIHAAVVVGGLFGSEDEINETMVKTEQAEQAEGNAAPPNSSQPDSTDGANTKSEEAGDKFNRRGRVRCPGGGHWLGLENNKRTGTVKFNAPEGTRIIEKTVYVSTIADNDGSHRKVQYKRDNYGVTSASVKFQCDPPNYPGAGGGWMEIELHGEYKPTSQ